MTMTWHDASKESPERYSHVLIWLKTNEITSAEYDPDSRSEPFYDADMEDFDGHNEFYVSQVRAWAKFPHRDEIDEQKRTVNREELINQLCDEIAEILLCITSSAHQTDNRYD